MTDLWKLWEMEHDPTTRDDLIAVTGASEAREAMRYFIASNHLGDWQRYDLFARAVDRLGMEAVRSAGVDVTIEREGHRRKCRDLGISSCPECNSFNVAPKRLPGPWTCQDCGRSYGHGSFGKEQ